MTFWLIPSRSWMPSAPRKIRFWRQQRWAFPPASWQKAKKPLTIRPAQLCCGNGISLKPTLPAALFCWGIAGERIRLQNPENPTEAESSNSAKPGQNLGGQPNERDNLFAQDTKCTAEKRGSRMPPSERRLYLIRELLKEQPQYQDIRIPAGRQEQKHLLRALLNVRLPAAGSAAGRHPAC